MSDSDPDQALAWFDSHTHHRDTPPQTDDLDLDATTQAEPQAEGGEEVDEGVCRVCRCGVEDGPLIDPCLCKGTMRYVHESCLADWVNVTGKDRCELCKHSLEYDNGQLHSPAQIQSDPPDRATLPAKHGCDVQYSVTICLTSWRGIWLCGTSSFSFCGGWLW